MTKFAMQDLTWPEIKAAFDRSQIVLLPVGSQEQHGPHLACSVDIAGSVAFADALAERVAPLALVAPPLNYGISTHHMPFPGTITLQPETFAQVLMDVATSLHHHGVRRILVINGHGGNQHALDIASVKMRRDLGIRMAYTLWPILGGTGGAKERIGNRRVGHACILETSMMMHLRPDLVRPDRLAEGELKPSIYGEASTRGIGGFAYWNEYTANGAFEGAPDATAEIGANIMERALETIEPFVRSFAEVPVDDTQGFARL